MQLSVAGGSAVEVRVDEEDGEDAPACSRRDNGARRGRDFTGNQQRGDVGGERQQRGGALQERRLQDLAEQPQQQRATLRKPLALAQDHLPRFCDRGIPRLDHRVHHPGPISYPVILRPPRMIQVFELIGAIPARFQLIVSSWLICFMTIRS